MGWGGKNQGDHGVKIKQIENYAPLGLVNAVVADWPKPDWRNWHYYDNVNSRKRATKDSKSLPTSSMMLLGRMSCLDMGEFFPDMELHGAGMHEIPDGGYLSRHLDGAVHPQTGWARKANAILFLNDDFSGGELCFDDDIVVPEKNKLVMFETSDTAWHWVNPVAGGSRKTLSLFWWSEEPIESSRICADFDK